MTAGKVGFAHICAEITPQQRGRSVTRFSLIGSRSKVGAKQVPEKRPTVFPRDKRGAFVAENLRGRAHESLLSATST